jgi:hypothetical protein
MQTVGYDCLVVPGAQKVTASAKVIPNSFCGGKLAVTNSGTAHKTVCSKCPPLRHVFKVFFFFLHKN